MTRPEYGKPETWPHRIPPVKDWTKVPGYQEQPSGIDERVYLSQRLGSSFLVSASGGMTPLSEEFGAWDWVCKLCFKGNGTYPVGREAVEGLAHRHLREEHGITPASKEDR